MAHRTGAAHFALACLLAGVVSGCITIIPTSPSPSFARVPGRFTVTGSMSAAREFASSTLLADGRVLIAGGSDDSGYLASAEIYDPANGAFAPTGSMTEARWSQTAALLHDGRVLVVGGADGSADVYDPATGVFNRSGTMSTPRQYHAAVVLADGRVLVAGGETDAGVLASAELYDPATGTFSPTGSMTVPRSQFGATLLRDGRVLVAGGINQSGVLESAELYDPVTRIFSPTGSMTTDRRGPSANVLPDGLVLVAGNGTSAELYDPATGIFARTGSMAVYPDVGTTLADGRVLFVGGGTPRTDPLGGDSTMFAAAEIYDPKSGTFGITNASITPRWHATVTLLRDGRVLVAGGQAPTSEVISGGTGMTVLQSAELFQP